MMGFRLGDILEQTDAGVLQGIQREIACDCWFTSEGKTTPRLIKIMDEEGIIHTVNEVQVLSSEEKRYSGIQTVEHICRIRIGNRSEVVKLVFSKENCKWTLVAV